MGFPESTTETDHAPTDPSRMERTGNEDADSSRFGRSDPNSFESDSVESESAEIDAFESESAETDASEPESAETDASEPESAETGSALLDELVHGEPSEPWEKVQSCVRQLREAYPGGADERLGVNAGFEDDAGIIVSATDDGSLVTVHHTFKEVCPDEMAAIAAATGCEVVGTDTAYQAVLETTENAVWIAPREHADEYTAAGLERRFDDWNVDSHLDRYPEWTFQDAKGAVVSGLTKTIPLGVLAYGLWVVAANDVLPGTGLQPAAEGAAVIGMLVWAYLSVELVGKPLGRCYRSWRAL